MAKSPKRPIVQKQVADAGRLSPEIPDDVKVAMASAIMAFSAMEMSAEQFIWDVLGLSMEDGKLLTQMDTKDKLELSKKLSERHAVPIRDDAEKALQAWQFMRDAIEARNKMAHGVWTMLDGTMPIVVSYRIPIEAGSINSEHFPIDRMNAITDTCWKLKTLFDAMAQKAQGQGPSPTQGAPQRPIYPEHPVPDKP